ncbi:(2Fe-2S)-binding protein [Marinobacter subterrani]|uniref:Aerobic-type carbon monoxide dehydrogenase, small subunit, CoxS/CutS family n=1 Tax=Marinobacter subterrani TaxID=1658765 RepID=A0A0J7J7H4_9GAMM|nr:(2Fe-2S)-binding protein [Marinobacter subterrani]KMQ73924.1 Aerobic-type carbon monoxide dehydrogenase, small subunit, CoxS/CutS family [Marinobacter subterrani]
MALRLTVNGQQHSLDVEADTPLLWVIRDELGLKGTKFGCGAGLCGACTVHLNGQPARSCSTPVEMAAGGRVETIEGLGGSDRLHALQEAWIAQGVPQCGYCQSGQIMSAAHLLASNPAPSRDDIVAAMAGNLCRCGTYSRIIAAVESVAAGPSNGQEA